MAYLESVAKTDLEKLIYHERQNKILFYISIEQLVQNKGFSTQ